MKKGTMLEALRAADRVWPSLLDEPDRWKTLDITYSPPRVERMWCQLGEMRLYLHRIHPCREALFHPHPWPSAVKILLGQYEMGVGYGRGSADPPEVATIVLPEGSEYEMIEPHGWHYVRPIGLLPTLSIMVTAPPWGSAHPAEETKKPAEKQRPLSEEDAKKLLQSFQFFRRAWRT